MLISDRAEVRKISTLRCLHWTRTTLDTANIRMQYSFNCEVSIIGQHPAPSPPTLIGNHLSQTIRLSLEVSVLRDIVCECLEEILSSLKHLQWSVGLVNATGSDDTI